jgi:HPt (histidine-containing phosphotransfer) domain-containing protein
MMEKTEYTHVNLEYLYEVSDGDHGFVKEIITDYLNNVPPQFLEMESAVAKADLEATKFIAHKIKSSFQFIGAQTLVNLATEIENTDGKYIKQVSEKNIELMKPIIEIVLSELKKKLTTL